MNAARYRTLHFVHPDLDVVESTAGLQMGATGGLATIEGDAAIRQAILLLLSTSPGERVMRPDYGCDLGKLIFEPNDDTTAGLAIHYVRRALTRWEPRVEIARLDAGPHPEDAARLVISLEYRVRASQRVEQLSLSINLSGESK